MSLRAAVLGRTDHRQGLDNAPDANLAATRSVAETLVALDRDRQLFARRAAVAAISLDNRRLTDNVAIGRSVVGPEHHDLVPGDGGRLPGRVATKHAGRSDQKADR